MLLGKYPIGTFFIFRETNGNFHLVKYLGDNNDLPFLGENLFDIYSRYIPTEVIAKLAYSNTFLQEKLDNNTLIPLTVNEEDYLLKTEEEIKEKCLVGSNKDDDGKLIDVVSLDYLEPKETYILSDGMCYSRETLGSLYSSGNLKNPVTSKGFNMQDKILSRQIHRKYRKRSRPDGGAKKTRKTKTTKITKTRKNRTKSSKK